MTAYMSRPDRNIAFCKLTNKQRVKIIRDGVTHELGRFDTKEEARAARDAFDDPRKGALQVRATLVAQQSAITDKTEFVDPFPQHTDAYQAVKGICQGYLDDPERLALQAQLDDRLYSMLQAVVRSGHPVEIACQIMGLSTKALQALTTKVLAARNA